MIIVQNVIKVIMSSQRWKGFERAIAKVFNTVRTPFSGSNSGITSSDSLHDRLYVECKFHSKQAILTLMKDTEAKAQVEFKTPIVALADPDSPKDRYIMLNIKHLYKIVREIDLAEIDKRFPQGTTIHKLVESSSSENRSLYDMKEQMTIQLKQIMREKLISGEDLEDVKSIGALLYFIDTIMDYSRSDDVRDA